MFVISIVAGKLQRQLSSTASLNTILTCTDEEFEVQTSHMTITDLELAQIFLQTELRLTQGYLEQIGRIPESE